MKLSETNISYNPIDFKCDITSLEWFIFFYTHSFKHSFKCFLDMTTSVDSCACTTCSIENAHSSEFCHCELDPAWAC